MGVAYPGSVLVMIEVVERNHSNTEKLKPTAEQAEFSA